MRRIEEKKRRSGVARRRWRGTAFGTVFLIVALGTQNTAIGEIGEIREGNENRALAALRENGKVNEERDSLERAFWETLERCDSPILSERDAAEDALAEHFSEYESIWQDRRFLTNGEITPEARARFELAEARYREKVFEECVDAFEAAFEIVAPIDLKEGRDGREPSGAEEKGEDGENSERKDADVVERNDEAPLLRGRVRLRWKPTLRVLYLAPDWSAFERRDAVGRRWRPAGRFSTPEIAPEFDASELTLETAWESWNAKNRENSENEGGEVGETTEEKEGETNVVGVLEGLVGGDFRVWTFPLTAANADNGENREKGEDGEDGEDKEDGRRVFQSGDAKAIVGETILKKDGEATARVRWEFVEAFDAFDSHRVWCDKNDFVLIIENVEDARATGKKKNKGIAQDALNRGKSENREKTQSEEGAFSQDKAREAWTPLRLRACERFERGVLLELDFPNEPAIWKAVSEGRARLACRVPRFFFWTRILVSGNESRSID